MEVILSFYFKGYALELPDTPFNIHSVMQYSLLNTEHSFLSEFIWILSSAKDQPVPHRTGQFQSADVFPKWILSFRALCTTKQHNQCQRYKAITLSKAAHSSFVFLRTRYAFYFTSSSSHLQMWNFKCRVLKKKKQNTTWKLQSFAVKHYLSTILQEKWRERMLHVTYRHPCVKKKNNLFHKKIKMQRLLSAFNTKY